MSDAPFIDVESVPAHRLKKSTWVRRLTRPQPAVEFPPINPALRPTPATPPHFASADTAASAPSRNTPRSTLRARIIITDAIVIITAIFSPTLVSLSDASQPLRWQYMPLACVLWLVVLAGVDSRNPRILGSGTTEYKRVFAATLVYLGILVIARVALDANVSRDDLLPSVPIGLAGLVLGRWGWRRWLRKERSAGRALSRVVLLGSATSIAHVAEQLRRHPDSGFVVVGQVDPAGSSENMEEADADEHFFSDLLVTMSEHRADTVMVTSSERITPERMRQLSWQLNRGTHHLVVAPSLNDVAGYRIQTRPVAGLSLIHVDAPNYTGPQRILKRGVDVVGSLVLLAALSGLFLAIALAVKSSSPGPVLYRQERIGRDGAPFAILKFRSMIIDADADLAKLLSAQGSDGTPLFKIRSDPRLTRVGEFLRRYSLDELPQLVNVFRGEMSLVGPRPQRPAEVALYNSMARRRLAVRPGMSGLWQVSGRSRLSWEEAIHLDLYYIENWSIAADLAILWRTVRAVFSSDGAY